MAFSPLRVYTSLDYLGRHLLLELHQQYQNGLYTDYAIRIASGKSIHCHRNVLATKSPFFKALFATGINMAEGESNELCLDHIDPYCVGALVEFCYRGSMEVPWEKIKDMVNAAEFLQVMDIKKECDTFILWKVQQRDAQEWYKFGMTYDLAETCKYIRNNYLLEIIDMEEFLGTGNHQMAEMINQHPWARSSEAGGGLLKAFLKWALHKLDERKDIFPKVLEIFKWTNEQMESVLGQIGSADRALVEESVYLTCNILTAGFEPPKPQILLIGTMGGSELKTLTGWTLGKDVEGDCYEWTQQWSFADILNERMFGYLLDCYGICALQSGFALTGGIFELCNKNDDSYASPFCNYYSKMEDKHNVIPLPSMNTARYKHGCESVNNTMYVFGGYIKDPKGIEITNVGFDEREVLPTKSMNGLDLDSMDWKPTNDMPHGLYSPISAVFGDDLYVFGTNYFYHWSKLYGKSVMMKYSTLTHTWEDLEEPRFRFMHASAYSAAFYEGKIWCLGSIVIPNERSIRHHFVSYDVAIKEWHVSTAFPDEGRYCMIKCADTLFCLCTDTLTDKHSIWEYDSLRERWDRSRSMEIPDELMSYTVNPIRAIEVPV